MTILFCDLVHSTGLAEGVDPEAYRRVQSRYFEEMSAVIERHGGTVEKFIGDDVMAVFGVPTVHEDDPLRAVKAAAEMQLRVEVLNDELAAWGIRLQVRIGVNTGEVVAGDPSPGQRFVSGEAVIVAKRLQQAASPGEILIGKATYPLVAHAVKAGPLERISVKGKQEDVGRRRVDEVDHAAPSLARRLDVPIVGREDEFRLLQRAFQQAVEEGKCRLFTVLGPAGIGKSRLARELATSLSGRATTAVGRCLPYGEGITFWPLTEILGAVGNEDELGEALGDERDVVLPLLRGATGVSETAGSSEETFWAVRRALEALARRRPLVVCFEDLHWAEPTLLDLVEYVVGWSHDAPILVLCLARPELVERRPTLIAPQPNAEALALEPLSERETEALLGHLETELPAAERERIGAAAEGNPLFVEQMAAMAAERNGEGFAIPPSIHALLVERLDRLSADERAVVERASVIGRDFSLPAVAALSTLEQRASLSRHLLALVRKGFVRPDPGRPEPEDRFSFNHVLIRDTAYEAMPKELRAELHERLADWIEAGTAREPDELVGYHLEQAYRARVEIGPRDEHARSLAERAGTLLGSAGRRALGRDDIPAAITLLQRAERLLEATQEERSAVLIELGLALRAGGRLEEADRMFAQANNAEAALERSSLRLFMDPSVAVDELLQAAHEAMDVFEAGGDDLGLARALIHVAEARWLLCRCAEMEDVLEQALVHAERAGARREISSILGLMAPAALVGPRPVDDAIRRCVEVRDRAPEGVVVEAHANVVLAVLEAMRGRTEEARRLCAETVKTLEDAGLTTLLALLRMYPGMVELLARDYEAAERELRLGYDELAVVGHQAYLSTTAAFLARPLYELGRYDDAMKLTLASEEAASRDDIASQVIWRGTRAKVLARREDAKAAERLAREAVDLARDTDLVNTTADALADLAETMRLLARDEDAARALEEAVQLYEAKGNLASAAAVRQT